MHCLHLFEQYLLKAWNVLIKVFFLTLSPLIMGIC